MKARILPEGSLDLLSRREVNQLLDAGSGGLYGLWRQCSLAVLNAGSEEDDIAKVLDCNPDFKIAIMQEEGGIAVEVENAPDIAFVEGQMIRGVRDQLFWISSVLIVQAAEFDSA